MKGNDKELWKKVKSKSINKTPNKKASKQLPAFDLNLKIKTSKRTISSSKTNQCTLIIQ